MNTRSLERRATRLQGKLQPRERIGLPASLVLVDENTYAYVHGDLRSPLPGNVYGFNADEDGIEDREG